MTSKPNNGETSLPPWAWLALIVLGALNLILFLALFATKSPSGESGGKLTLNSLESIALNLQILEAFLAALAIGLAVFGFVGFNTIRSAAMRAAAETARDVAEQVAEDILKGSRVPYSGDPVLTDDGTEREKEDSL